MTYRDPKLKAHCKRVSALATDWPSEELPVLCLFDAFYFFRVTEGEDSPRATEAMEHLLSPELRPALRQWYKRCGPDMNENALRFRDQFSEMAGEKFG
jgi:hypothetical protein